MQRVDVERHDSATLRRSAKTATYARCLRRSRIEDLQVVDTLAEEGRDRSLRLAQVGGADVGQEVAVVP
jgi:hypothetical protein